jgi:tetratricopeptide (TPR) repeat protein
MNRTQHALRLMAGLFFIVVAASAGQAPAGQANAPQGPAADLLKQGRKLSSEGKQDEALALYRQALQASPNLFQAHLLSGMALDLKGKYQQAREELAKGIDGAPPQSKAQAMKTMAISYAFTCGVKDAAKYEQQAFDMQLAAKDYYAAGESADELARIELECGDVNGAAHWYRTGYETGLKQPDITPARKDLWEFRWEHAQARLAARRGNKAEAEKHVAAAKAILDKGDNKDQARFFPYLTGYVAFYSGDYKTAIADLQQADQKDPFILSLLAQAYEKSGDQSQAMDYYHKILAFNFHNPPVAFARPLAQKKVGSASSAQ